MSPHYALMAGYYWYWTREQANNVFHNIMCHLRVLSYRLATYKCFILGMMKILLLWIKVLLLMWRRKQKKIIITKGWWKRILHGMPELVTLLTPWKT